MSYIENSMSTIMRYISPNLLRPMEIYLYLHYFESWVCILYFIFTSDLGPLLAAEFAAAAAAAAAAWPGGPPWDAAAAAAIEAAAAAAAAWSGRGAPDRWLPSDTLGGISSLGGKEAADGGKPGIPAIDVINPGGGTPPGNWK